MRQTAEAMGTALGKKGRGWRGALLAGAAAAACLISLPAQADGRFDVRTEGGAVAGARVIHVTTLADDGPGSLREAADAPGPRVIVFDVAGYIDLKSDIDIRPGKITVAGQTAPSPGVVLRSGSIRIRAGEAVIEHVGVYPGPAGDPKIDGERDGITLISSLRKNHPVHDVILRNVSLGWATDENLDLFGDDTRNVLVEHALIAKGLRHTDHPKVIHSMGLLIGPDVKGVAVIGSVFAFNNRRNPHISPGDQIYFAGNLVYDFGEHLVELYRGLDNGPLMATIRDNLFVPGPDTACEARGLLFQHHFAEQSPGTRILYADNGWNTSLARPGCAQESDPLAGFEDYRASSEPVTYPAFAPKRPGTDPAPIVRLAGMRPADRPPIDAVIVKQIADGTGHVIDNPAEDGGWLPITPVTRVADAPVTEVASPADLAALRGWLCRTHLKVGGSPYPGCER